MISVSSVFARSFFRRLKLDAETRVPTASLAVLLNEHLIASGKALDGGMAIVSQMANGHSFDLAQLSGYSPVQYQEMVEELFTAYENAVSALTTAENPTPADSLLYLDVMNSLAGTANVVLVDHSGVRR